MEQKGSENNIYPAQKAIKVSKKERDENFAWNIKRGRASLIRTYTSLHALDSCEMKEQ